MTFELGYDAETMIRKGIDATERDKWDMGSAMATGRRRRARRQRPALILKGRQFQSRHERSANVFV